MMSKELNSTMMISASTIAPPRNECIDLEQFKWVINYHPPFMWFIFILGFIENLFVISVFILHKSRCTVAEIYLGNMATADLILVSGLPFWAIYISNSFYWPFGGFMCVAVSFFFQLNFYGTIYFLLMVSIDRYLALVKTMSAGLLRTPWCAKVSCAIIWMCALVFSIPTMVFRKLAFIPEFNTTACIEDAPPDWSIAVNITLSVIGFLVPVGVIIFCTSKIIFVLRNNVMQQYKEVKNEKKATWLVLSVLLVFTVCWLPFHISTFMDMLEHLNIFPSCTVKSVNYIFTQISTYIALSNSCINPIMYVMIGNHFRNKAKEVYTGLLCRGSARRKFSFPTDSTRISFSTGP